MSFTIDLQLRFICVSFKFYVYFYSTCSTFAVMLTSIISVVLTLKLWFITLDCLLKRLLNLGCPQIRARWRSRSQFYVSIIFINKHQMFNANIRSHHMDMLFNWYYILQYIFKTSAYSSFKLAKELFKFSFGLCLFILISLLHLNYYYLNFHRIFKMNQYFDLFDII